MQILTPTPCCLYVKNLWQRIVSGFFFCLFLFLTGTPCKAEQSLQSMELQEKEEKTD